MKTELSKIAQDLEQGVITEDKARTFLLGLLGVSIMLPKLVTEYHNIEWLAYLDGVKGVVCSGKTEMEAIDQLMISVKVKLLYDRGN